MISHLSLALTQLVRGELLASWNTLRKGLLSFDSNNRKKCGVLLTVVFVILLLSVYPKSASVSEHHRTNLANVFKLRESNVPSKNVKGRQEPVPLGLDDLQMTSTGPKSIAEGAYAFRNVCMTFNTHNQLEKTERGLVWFDKEYHHPKRCVPCSNPLISFKWQEANYRDYFGEMGPAWEKDGGLLRDVRKGKHGCGMMWVHKITVHNLTDYNQCMRKNQIEIRDRGQTQRPKEAKHVIYYPGSTLVLNWYHRNIGHQLFDSLTSLMPLLHDLFKENAASAHLPYERVAVHQLPKCDDSFYICNVLRRLGAFKDKEFVDFDDDTMPCFENLIVPRSGYFGRSHGARQPKAFDDFRHALFRGYELSQARAVPIPYSLGTPKKPHVLFYRHASTQRRVWLKAEEAISAFKEVFEVVDVYDFGKLSLRDQADHFHSADLLLMAHGAQFANVIFCSDGAVVYEISCTGYSHVEQALPPKMYGVIHKSWRVPGCTLEGVETGDILDANFTLTVDALLPRLVQDDVLASDAAAKIQNAYDANARNSKGTGVTGALATARPAMMNKLKKEPGKIDFKNPRPEEEPNKPDTGHYEYNRWNELFDMTHRDTEVTCESLPKIIPRYNAYRWAAKHVRDWPEAEMGKPKILCWAFTRTGLEDRANALVTTWGRWCDELVFVSNAKIEKFPSIVVHLDDDSHDNLWNKLKISIKRVYENYGGQYDWYYKVDDDTFAMMGNLRKYLLSDQVQEEVAKGKGVYLGRSMDSRAYMKGKGGCRFNVGGSGYIFDEVAMKRLSEVVTSCKPGVRSSADDMLIGCCVEEMLGILPIDTRGENGGERFHPFDPQFCSDYTLPKDPEEAMLKDWFYSYSLKPIKEKYEHCAPDTVAWHHLPPHYVHQLYKLWYDCPELLGE